jgi:hypothetical protein
MQELGRELPGLILRWALSHSRKIKCFNGQLYALRFPRKFIV